MRKTIAAFAVLLSLLVGLLPAGADSSAPVAENLEFETYRGVSFGGTLAAVDPDGRVLTFEITTQPVKGTIALGDNGKFVYTPDDGKRGRDYFGYKAIDADGNSSQEATVIIRLLKNKSVSYADMDGSASYCAAVKLAECGAFIGSQLGGEYYFEPEASVSRGEFLAMCMTATGTELLSGVVSTGFTDDDDIPEWQKAYIASAVRDGIAKGKDGDGGLVFDSGAAITRAEAAVFIDRTLRLNDVSYIDVGGDVPAWAAQAAANIEACGIGTVTGGGTLTRAEAADLLVSAMAVLENR